MTDAVAAPPAAVRCRGLAKRYGERDALLDLDLDVPVGTCHGFLGPNGSGKTTFLKLVSGLFRPTAGSIEVLGLAVPERAAEARARSGFMFDRPLVPEHLSLLEALDYVADLQGGGVAPGRRDELLERVGLTWRRRDPISTFSRGMAQRASLVCALLHDPEILVFDEPFTGLDPQGCALVESEVTNAVAEGRTVLLVTHELRRAERLCDTVTWLERGRPVRTSPRGSWHADEIEGVA